MHYLALLAASGIASAAVIEQRAPGQQEYYLKTHVTPNQSSDKTKYSNLYVETYHTGAGLNDATLQATTATAARGYLVNPSTVGPTTYYNQIFEGGQFPNQLVVDYSSTQYASWQPVRINAGTGGNDSSVTGFYTTPEEGLKWTSTPETPGKAGVDAFGGWIVCDWWHGRPQVFVRSYNNTTPLPSSCADVQLKIEYVPTH